MLKKLFILFFGILLHQSVYPQQHDSLLQVMDSLTVDSLADNTQPDSLIKNDSISNIPVTSSSKKVSGLNDILKDNPFLNSGSAAVARIQAPRNYIQKDLVFYFLTAILLFLGIIKVTWQRYFSNLVRVFFNTSLRQGQLTDQLLQAKLPSMFFNLFFVLIGGWYLFLLLNYFGKISYNNWNILLICISGVMLVYVLKFCTLKFAGWLTGYKSEAETYIFIVFLNNKIMAMCLVPIVIIIPFSNPELANITVIISYIIIVLMFVLRFFRSYGLLQTRLKVSGFHFLLYIIGIELLPLLLIYKLALVILTKSL